MSKRQKSYRFSSETFEKLEKLVDISNSQANILGLKGQSETEIIEEAIDQLYLLKVDSNVGSPYLNRMESCIRQAVSDALLNRDEVTNNMLFLEYQALEILYLFAKYHPDLPRDKTKILDVLYNRKSVYEDYIPDCVRAKLSEKK